MHVLELNYIIFSISLIILLAVRRGSKEYLFFDYLFIAISFFVLMYLHVAVDVNSVEDLPAYKQMFTKSYTYSLSSNFSSMWSKEYLFVIYNYLISFITHDYVFYLIIYNTILIGCHYWLSVKYSPYIPLSIVLFILFTYSQSLFVIRQYLTLSLILITVPLIINRKLFSYLCVCMVAFFIHNSAIMWFPIYFFYGIKNKKLFLGSLGAMAILFILLNTEIGSYILMLGFSYDTYIMDGGIGQASMFAKLVPTIYLLCYVHFLRGDVLDEGINKLCLITLTLLCIGYVFTPPIGILGRIMQYYQTLSIIAIPIMLSYIHNRAIRMFVLISILCLQGFSSMKPLQEEYFSSYSLNSFDYSSFFAILLLTIIMIILIRKYQKKSVNFN